ncbi:MAG: gluconate 5-dehydrogenase [Candidatus Methanoperedens nitroreducens]|uniref:Gluconate 5-dehydrogenase n=1 Tax=Candidatus Methanoperedens nitratireducens TaxID=1392998 RepID=A0A0P8CKN3_9EURY|nr:3-oxoacyl-ACP reductase family protein [Candidatus Methanoperedens sp. BLZ2]KAB2948425.1 MAG: 3-oxoacyl-ACP reductase FabG [Candidatus Methanoperedens sp.]KPQ43648.1 MAG: gluconate 5-dehydrogenase [Candidatus Methanoperedens sp. BLZ1]MBZ0174482.1 3-oxoacyl-ACP reductase FabG [Candidatus Methanoperedens nitroreducens]CAG1002729.1 3-oxoacyl-[acyl-carrier protein] reductase [Methanosarcinales archaeon]MCX9078505.1 3-oxoacyl-ACP reductase FabG [Candidatus Methanoperedens sp.]
MGCRKKGRLDGKVALVTGGSRGIGKAISLRLAEEGADVVINYQNTKEHAETVSKLIDMMGMAGKLEKIASQIHKMDNKEHAKEFSRQLDAIEKHSYICQANVSNFEQVKKMQEEVIKQFGKLDILINNAGIVRDKSFVKMTSDMWDDVMHVNLDGSFYCTKAFIEGMLERKYGRVINISSVVGRMGNFGQANYTASKAGMIGLTKALAKEFAGKGVTVNAIAPGFIETDMVKGVPGDVMDKILAKIPLGRLGKASEVAGTVAFLASQEGDYITGQVIDINGGLYI